MLSKIVSYFFPPEALSLEVSEKIERIVGVPLPPGTPMPIVCEAILKAFQELEDCFIDNHELEDFKQWEAAEQTSTTNTVKEIQTLKRELYRSNEIYKTLKIQRDLQRRWAILGRQFFHALKTHEQN